MFYSEYYSLVSSVNSVAEHRKDLKHINLWDIPLSDFYAHLRELIAHSNSENEKMKRQYPELYQSK